MNFKNVLRIASIGVILAVSSTAANAAAQTHHCKKADGTMDTTLTKKQCLAAKGKWAKDAAAPAASAAPAAAAPAATTPAAK